MLRNPRIYLPIPTICILIFVASLAQAQSVAPFCANDTKTEPSGIVRTYKETSLRICSNSGNEIVGLNLNPETVPDIENTRALNALSVRFGDDRLADDPLWYTTFADTEELIYSGVHYTRWLTKIDTDDNGEPGHSVYLTNGNNKTPKHSVYCYGEEPSGGGTCFILMSYKDIRARLMLIGEFEDSERLPREQFPALARSMFAILEYIDIQ